MREGAIAIYKLIRLEGERVEGDHACDGILWCDIWLGGERGGAMHMKREKREEDNAETLCWSSACVGLRQSSPTYKIPVECQKWSEHCGLNI